MRHPPPTGTDKFILGVFNTLIIKRDRVGLVWPDGLDGFIVEHSPQDNNELLAIVDMGQGFMPIVEELLKLGLKEEEDFWIGDVERPRMFEGLGKKFQITLETPPWLIARKITSKSRCILFDRLPKDETALNHTMQLAREALELEANVRANTIITNKLLRMILRLDQNK